MLLQHQLLNFGKLTEAIVYSLKNKIINNEKSFFLFSSNII
jgi:hypothetical protein